MFLASFNKNTNISKFYGKFLNFQSVQLFFSIPSCLVSFIAIKGFKRTKLMVAESALWPGHILHTKKPVSNRVTLCILGIQGNLQRLHIFAFKLETSVLSIFLPTFAIRIKRVL